MKIVIATTSGFHLRHLARELIASGHNVAYLNYLPWFRNRRDAIPSPNVKSFFWRLQPWSTAALFRPWRALRHAAVESIFHRADEAYAAALPCCDVFIGLSALSDRCAEAARSQFGAKIVIDRGSRHVLSQDALLRAGGGAGLSSRYIDRELASYDRADAIALPSDHAVQSFVANGFSPQKLFKNVYGVDCSRFLPAQRPSGPLRVLFVGQWSRRKGCDALSALLARRPDLTLTHVGSAHDLSFPAQNNFVTLGHLPHPALHHEMTRHHMLVLPSREDGFGMVLSEALASGLAVIGSTLTGAPDLRAQITDKSWIEIVPPADVDALETAISRLEAVLRRQPTDHVPLSESDRAALGWCAYARRYADFLKTLNS